LAAVFKRSTIGLKTESSVGSNFLEKSPASIAEIKESTSSMEVFFCDFADKPIPFLFSGQEQFFWTTGYRRFLIIA